MSEPVPRVGLRCPAAHAPERRYALETLLDVVAPGAETVDDDAPADVVLLDEVDPSGRPGEAPLPRGLLDEVVGALTLRAERDAAPDAHGRVEPARDGPDAPWPVAGAAARLTAVLSAAGIDVRPARDAGGARFLVGLTHDVDTLGGAGLVGSLARLAAGSAVRPRSARARRLRLEGATRLRDRVAGVDTAFPVAAIEAVERRHDRRSTHFFLVGHEHPEDGPRRPYHRHLRDAAARVAAGGGEVALHASYLARDRPGRIAAEATALAAATGHAPRGMRHHFLRLGPRELAAELDRAGLTYDSSVAWAGRPGLRAGTPWPYRLWDETTRRATGWELPLAVMDTTLAAPGYLALDPERGFRRAVRTLEAVAAAAGACALLWHPPYHHPRLSAGYDDVYGRLLGWIGDAGGWAGPAGEVLDRWRARRPAAAPS